VEETALWIQNLGGVLGWNETDTNSIANKFRHYEIDGKWIEKLENSRQLREIKIEKLGHRMAIVKVVKDLCSASKSVEWLKREKVDIIDKYFQNCSQDSESSEATWEISTEQLYSILNRRQKLMRHKKLNNRNRNDMFNRNTYLRIDDMEVLNNWNSSSSNVKSMEFVHLL